MKVAVDTNVLVRFLVRDEETQFKAAYVVLAHQQIFVPDSVLLETDWVLRFSYDFSARDVCLAFRHLIGMKNIVLENSIKIAKVLEWHESSLNFADALHLAKSEHVSEFKTFDATFIKRAKGLSECKVSSP